MVAIGVSLVIPIALLTTVLVSTEAQVRAAAVDAASAEPLPAGPYSQTFVMTIEEQDRSTRLWLMDLDTEPYFRQTVETSGSVESDQIYRFDERTLYTADRFADGQAVAWNSVAPVDPADLGLSNLISGPATWAAEFGPGEFDIPIGANVTVRVIIESVDDPIEPTIFELPAGATVTPVQP